MREATNTSLDTAVGSRRASLSAIGEVLPHYDALDGLRGVAVSMVVLFHFWQSLPRYEHPFSAGVTRVLGLMLIGQKGVDLFFVLSGFLITGILLRTKGSASYFKTFYMRRTLRIFPLYFLVVFACLAAGAIFDLPQHSWHNTGWYLLYLQNVVKTFWPDSIAGPGHFWSLAVEEHFYAFWPLAVLFLSRKALTSLCLLLIVMPVLIRAWFLNIGLDVFTFTLCRIDTLAMGSLVAVIFANTEQRPVLVRWSRALFLPMLVLSFGSFFVFSGAPSTLSQTFKYSLFAILCSLILVMTLSPGRFNVFPRLFVTSALRSLGKISYAIYVFHPFVLAAVSTRFYASVKSPIHGRFYAALLTEFLLYLILTVAVARLSWMVFERPILKLKDRFKY